MTNTPALIAPGWPITIAVVVVVIAVLLFLVWLKRQLSGEAALPYRPVPSLLTLAEGVFYRALLSAVAGMPVVVLAKVRLADLVEIPRGTESHQSHRARVQSKHVDFVLCELQTLRPLLVIELDDSSHHRRDRMERDAFVDAVMRTIGLPIWHVPCAGKYSVPDLREGVAARVRP